MIRWLEILLFFCCILFLATTGISLKIKEVWLGSRVVKAEKELDRDLLKLRQIETEIAREKAPNSLLKKIKDLNLESEMSQTTVPPVKQGANR